MNPPYPPYPLLVSNYWQQPVGPVPQYRPPLHTNANRDNALQIRGLSPAIGYYDRDALFYGLGATSVHNYPFYTIAYFHNESACREVIQHLHQRYWPKLTSASKRLRVEFLQPNQPESRIVNCHTVCDSSLKIAIRQEQKQAFQSSSQSRNLNSASSAININNNNCPLPQFNFPKASLSVIKRIGKQLIENVNFYHHVLLLMLQLKLKPPFDEDNAHDESDFDSELDLAFLNDIKLPESNKRVQDDLLCSDESEIETENENLINIKSFSHKPKKRKAIKNLKTGFVGVRAQDASIVPPKPKTPYATITTSIDEVFEETREISRSKSVEIKMIKIDNDEQHNPSDVIAESEIISNFGTLELTKPPESKKSSSAFDVLEVLSRRSLISDSDLAHNCIPQSEWSQHKIFKGYKSGEVSRRLYIKNLPKKTNIEDLYCIFGKFIELDNNDHLNSFDIVLMSKGRMHGQAFVSLPSEPIAEEALKRTNGYVLHGNPIVVAFSYSRKAQTEND